MTMINPMATDSLETRVFRAGAEIVRTMQPTPRLSVAMVKMGLEIRWSCRVKIMFRTHII